MEQTLKLLQKLALCNTLCFHGSKLSIGVLTPQQANCMSGRPEGNQKAVYATPDDVAVAIVKALLAFSAWGDPKTSSYSRTGNGPLKVTGQNVTFSPGYVHVLSRKTFKRLGDEFVSYVPVQSHARVLVTPRILRHMPDIETDIYIPYPY